MGGRSAAGSGCIETKTGAPTRPGALPIVQHGRGRGERAGQCGQLGAVSVGRSAAGRLSSIVSNAANRAGL